MSMRNRTQRRWVAVIVGATLSLSLSACTSSSPDDGAIGGEQTPGAQATADAGGASVDSSSPAAGSSDNEDPSSASTSPTTLVEAVRVEEGIKPSVNDKKAKQTYCDVDAEVIAGYAVPAPSSEASDAVRDALFVLEERIIEWRFDAYGRPSLEAVVDDAEAVANAWRDALRAFDSGDTDEAEAALRTADDALAALEAETAQARSDCAR